MRAIHTRDANKLGGTAYLIERDPYLAYQLGRNLNYREFRERDGVFGKQISNLAGPMPDGTTAKITANNHVSCSACHNLPQGNPGGGVNFSKDSGVGRNTPHYYGAGLIEMLAIQVRTQILRQVDTDANGWISIAEAQASGGRLSVPTGTGPAVNFGDARLSKGSTGVPSLNNIFRVWYVDRAGKVVAGATEVDGSKTVGYNFNMVVWGWGQGVGRSALNPTNRAFLWDPWKTHGGLESYDPSTTNDPDGDGVSVPTVSGAIQFPATHKPNDEGNNLDALGFSRDDPDGDGHLNEISEGDLDLAEWFMLNAPRPAFAGSEQEFRTGVYVMEQMGCASCHTPSWKIEARTTGNGSHDFAGDRRLFDFGAKWNAKTRQLEGKHVPLHKQSGGVYARGFGSFVVDGMFSDLKHHDMGPGFEEIDFGGYKNRWWRTAPLWGVGSGFPWGHGGQSLTLEDVILRHGGEAKTARDAWAQAPDWVRSWMLGFFRKLQLYDIESLPADINGDGKIGQHLYILGKDTRVERFNAEWMFKRPVQIQGDFKNPLGELSVSYAATNLAESYGLNLPLRKDSDGDGWPDVWDAAPFTPGYRDGVR